MQLFFNDLLTILHWYFALTIFGVIFFPVTSRLFPYFPDRGYPLSKFLGIALVGYSVWFLGSLKILAFNFVTIIIVLGIWAGIILLSCLKNLKTESQNHKKIPHSRDHKNIFRTLKFTISHVFGTSNFDGRVLIVEELFFLTALLFWAFIRGHEPSLHSLEKFMDYGFMNAIGRTGYFPPQDMWLAPAQISQASPDTAQYAGGFFINYYYFGHYITAFLTKLTGIASEVTYNLMLATLFAFSWTASFGIGIALLKNAFPNIKPGTMVAGGILSGFLVTLAGNLHTIYIFTSGYPNEEPVPFWNILEFSWNKSYWYPNATRFIPNTIHEFPSYSWVVADLHGHVLDIPFVLVTLAVLLNFILNTKYKILNTILLGFMCAVMYMTNAWDGLIYLGLSFLVICTTYIIHPFQLSFTQISNFLPHRRAGKFLISKQLPKPKPSKKLGQLEHLGIRNSGKWLGISIIVLIGSFALFTMPFNLHFKPFVSGFGVVGGWEIARFLNLIPENAETVVKVGPFLLEKGNNLRSPLWMLGVLWGFFYFFVGVFIFLLIRSIKSIHTKYWKGIFQHNSIDLFLLLLILISTMLLIFPEFFYAKDIYPAHYRANTMFKLGYQAYIMLSLVSAFTFIKLTQYLYEHNSIALQIIRAVAIILLLLVGIYSYFGIQSYYGVLPPVNRLYEGQDGIAWLKAQYPGDYAAIMWLRNRPTANGQRPTTILEAVGDSYTDYARISAYTGLPTVVGWPVHEWLWRGSYDEPGKRVEEVKQAYETPVDGDIAPLTSLIEKYNITYIVVGSMERQKYANLNEEAIQQVGTPVFTEGETAIYEVKSQ